MSSPNDGPPSGGTATDPTGPRADGAGSDGVGSNGAAAPDKPAGRRGLKRSTRVALLIILVIALLAGGVFAASYLLDARNYVTTDNAQVDGDKIAVNAPASGTLIDWRANQGAELTADQVVGRIKVNGGFRAAAAVDPGAHQRDRRGRQRRGGRVRHRGDAARAGLRLLQGLRHGRGWTRPTSTRSPSGSGSSFTVDPLPDGPAHVDLRLVHPRA